MMILWFLTIEPKITRRSVPSSPGRSFLLFAIGDHWTDLYIQNTPCYEKLYWGQNSTSLELLSILLSSRGGRAYLICVTFFLTLMHFEASKFYIQKCVNLQQKFPWNKTVQTFYTKYLATKKGKLCAKLQLSVKLHIVFLAALAALCLPWILSDWRLIKT